MHRSFRGWQFRSVAVLATTLPWLLACNEVAVELPRPDTLQVFPGDLAMYVGDQASVNSQVVDQNGNVMPSAPVFWESTNRTVVTVTSNYANAFYAATVVASGAGTAEIVATSGTLSDTIHVTVSGDQRSFIVRSLNIIPDSVSTDVNAPVEKYPVVEYRAVDGAGIDRCTSYPPPSLVFRSNASVATGANVGTYTCQIRVNPIGPGSTYLVVSVGDARDSVKVNVSDTHYTLAISDYPDASRLVAGDSVTYQVQILDATGAGVAGETVSFGVDGGSVAAVRATTGSNGKASVLWRLPQKPVAATGTGLQLTAATEYPNGIAATTSVGITVSPNKTALFVFSHAPGGTDTVAADTTALGWIQNFYVLGFDKFGNARNTNAILTVTNPDIGILRMTDAGNAQQVAVSGYLPGTTSAILTEQGFSDTLPVVILAGSRIVYRTNVNDVIRTGQITTSWLDTTVYGGAKPVHSPVWTTVRDTVAFMLTPLSGGWAPFAAAGNGSQAGTPVSLLGGDTVNLACTYVAGFPVFKTRAGTMGDVIFISDSAGGDESNIYIVNRSNGAETKVTANNNPYVVYRGLSLSPDESKVLVATAAMVDPTPANGDSSVASNVYEVTLATGAATLITPNADTRGVTGISYNYATYSPDGAQIYIDRSDPAGRELLVYQGGAYRQFDLNGTGLYEATFNPSNAGVIAYRDGSTLYYRNVGDPQSAEVAANRTNILYFSWSRR